MLNAHKDKKGGLARSHKKSLEIANDFTANLDLIDAWRFLKPQSRRFTWRQKKPMGSTFSQLIRVHFVTPSVRTYYQDTKLIIPGLHYKFSRILTIEGGAFGDLAPPS